MSRPFLTFLSGYRGEYVPRSPVMVSELKRALLLREVERQNTRGAHVRKPRVVIPWPATNHVIASVEETTAEPTEPVISSLSPEKEEVPWPT